MTGFDIFVIFGIPAIALTVAYAAMRANEYAVQRSERKGDQ